MELRQQLWQRLRSAFVAGLLITVPIGVSIGVILALAGWVDSLQPEMLYGGSIPGFGILLVFTVILLVGFTTQNWLGSRFVGWYEGLVHQVPIVSSLYKGVKQVVETVLSDGHRSVKAVVMVEWPREGTWSLGFVTGTGFLVREDGRRLLNVFVPSTPNPTTGFYFMVAEEEVVHTELTFEDAAKLLMSAGLVGGPKPIQLARAQERIVRSQGDGAAERVP